MSTWFRKLFSQIAAPKAGLKRDWKLRVDLKFQKTNLQRRKRRFLIGTVGVGAPIAVGVLLIVFQAKADYFTDNMNAANVIGQSTFTSAATATSQTGMNNPELIAYDVTNSRLFVPDSVNNRVLVYTVSAVTNGMTASFVLGQPNFTSNTAATTQAGMNHPQGVACDSNCNRLFVSDTNNNRVLVYNTTPGTIANGMNASNVLGQSGFTTGTSVSGQSGFNSPYGLAYDSLNSRLFVADFLNARVLAFNVASITNGQNATNIIGSTSFSVLTNGNLSQSSMNIVSGLAYDAVNKHLFVSDMGNNRIMVFDVASVPFTNGLNAINMLGGTSYTTRPPDATVTAGSLYQPRGVTLDMTNNRLFVADGASSRILMYDIAVITNGENAVNVLGQANLTASGCGISQTQMCLPSGVVFDSARTRLFESELVVNRVKVYDPTALADLALTNTIDNPTPTIGGTVTYVVGVTNFTGTVGVTGVTVQDSLPSGVTFVSSTQTAGTTYDSTTGVWTIGTMAAFGSAKLTIQATVNAGAAGTTFTNTAQITASSRLDPDSTVNNSVSTEDDQASNSFTRVAVTQNAYRWRNDNGTEAAATYTSAENAPLTNIAKNTLERVRFGVANPSSELLRKASLALASGENLVTTGVIDAANGFAYFGTQTTPGKIVKVRLSDFTEVATLTLNTGENSLRAAIIDTTNGYAYFTSGTQPAIIVKVDVNPARTFARVASLTLAETNASVTFAAIDTTNGYGYYAAQFSGTTPTRIVKVRLGASTAAPVEVATLDLNASEYNVTSGVIDVSSGNAFFGNDHGYLIEVAIGAGAAAPTRIANQTTFGVFSNNIALLDTSGATHYAYFAGSNSSGTAAQVQKLRLSDFTVMGFFDSPSGENRIISGDIDTARGMAYFVTSESPTKVVKVSLGAGGAAPVRVGGVVTNTGDDNGRAAVLDPANGYFYFANNGSPGKIVKVSVAGHGSYRLEYGQKTSSCAAIASWTQVAASPTTEHWQMADSANLTDGGATTDSSGVTNGATTFKAGQVKDTASQAAQVVLFDGQFTEMEYSIKASTKATGTNNYCFRLTDAGTALATYSNYAELSLQSADLSLTDTVNNPSPNVGGTVTYTVTLSNGGPSSATNVTVTDTLPTGVTFVSAAPSVGTFSSGVWTVGTVASGGSANITINGTVNPGTAGTTATNTAEVSASDQTDPDSTSGNNAVEDDLASASFTVPSADLSLTKTVNNATPAIGGTVVFTATVTNGGPAIATGVTVQDLLPSGLTYVSSAPSQGSYVNGTGAWTVGTIASGASPTLIINATVNAGSIGSTATNTAQVSASDLPDPDSTPNDNDASQDDQASAIITLTSSDLSITNTVNNATPNVGGTVIYTLTVTNGGPTAATNVTVKDQLPTGVTYVSSVPSAGSYVSASGIWTVGSIASGASKNITITGTVNTGTSGTTITNTAQVFASDQPDPDSTPGDSVAGQDDQASVGITVTKADLSLTNTVNNASPNVGGTVIYTVTVTNGGPTDATGVSAKDLLPTGVTFVSNTTSQGSYASATGTWTIGAIASGASKNMTITATVNAGTGGTLITNTAQVFASDQPDPDSTPNNSISSEDDQASVGITVSTSTTFSNIKLDFDAADEAGFIQENSAKTNFAGGIVDLENTSSTTGGVAIVNQVVSTSLYSTVSDDLIVPLTGTITSWRVYPTTSTSLKLKVYLKNGANNYTLWGESGLQAVTGGVANGPISTTIPVVAGDKVGLYGANNPVTSIGGSGFFGWNGTDFSGTGAFGFTSTGQHRHPNVEFTVNTRTTTPTYVTTSNTTQLKTKSWTGVNSMAITQSMPTNTVIKYLVSFDGRVSWKSWNGTSWVSSTLATAQTNGMPMTSIQAMTPANWAASGGFVAGTTPTIDVATSLVTFDATVTPSVDQITFNYTTGVDTSLDYATANESNYIQSDATNGTDFTAGVAKLHVTGSSYPLNTGYTVTTSDTNQINTSAWTVMGGLRFTQTTPALTSLKHLVSFDGRASWKRWNGTSWTSTTLASIGTVFNTQAELEALTWDNFQASGGFVPGTTTKLDFATEFKTADATVTPTLDQISVEYYPPATSAADLSLTKTVSNASPNVGNTVTYTVTVTNGGPLSAANVTVLDLLPTGVTYVSSAPSAGSYVSGTGVWTVGTIASGTSKNLTITGTVNTGTAGTTITNTAQVTASDQFDPDSTPNNSVVEDDQASVGITVQSADLSLTKTVDNPTPNVGANVIYTVTVTNSGTSTATGVSVKDLLPAGLTFVSATSTQGTYASATGTWTVGTIANAASKTLTITASVNAGTGGTTATNTAEVFLSDQADPDSTPNDNFASQDDQESVAINVQNQADLSLTNSVDNPTPNIGDTVVYTVTVLNGGPNNAANVQATDLLPAGVTYVSSSPSQGSYDSASGTWTIGTIAASTSKTLSITATVNAGTGGTTITNSAQVTASDQADSDSAPNNSVVGEDDQASATINVGSADLSVTTSIDDPTPVIGQNVTYTVTVANAGPSSATGVSVKDLLPTGMSFVSATPSQGSYSSATGTWTIGTIVSGDSKTLSITATVVDGIGKSTIVNLAQVSASDLSDPDSTPNNDNASEDDQASVTLSTQTSDLSLTKTVSDSSPNVGQSVTYTIIVSNAGPNPATNVQVKDLLSSGLTFASATSTQGTFVSSTGIWTVGGVASGASKTLNITAQVGSGNTSIPNIAQVVTTDQADPDSTPDNDNASEDDQASAAITVGLGADLSLSKAVDNRTPSLGGTVTYTLTLSNAGLDATGVSVKDLLPAGVTFVSATASQGSYSSASGTWTVGTVANGATKTLAIVATVDVGGTITNTAQVSASGVSDPDSMPDNDAEGEDDQASAIINVSALEEEATLFNHVRLARTKIGVANTLGIDFTLQSPLDGPLTVTVPSGFTITHSFTSGSCSGGGTIDEFAFDDQAHVITAEKHSCSGRVRLTGATVENPDSAGTFTFTWVNDAPGEDEVTITETESPITAVAIKDVMSREAVLTLSTHDLSMNLPTSGIGTGETLRLTYAGFTTDFAASPTIVVGCGAGSASGTVSGNVLTVTGGITPCTGTLYAFGYGGTNPGSVGQHDVAFSGTSGVHGSFTEPILDSDQVTIAATVAPSITFDIDLQSLHDSLPDDTESAAPYALALGTVSTADTRVSGTTDGVDYIMLDLAANASSGVTVTVQNLHGADGLVSESVPGDHIASSDGPVADGLENYGLCSVAFDQEDGGPILPVAGAFSAACSGDTEGNSVLGFDGTPQTLYSSAGPIAFARMMIAVQASISNATASHNDYQDILTFIATGTF